MSEPKRKTGARTSGLLGDLESIRTLLEDDATAATGEAGPLTASETSRAAVGKGAAAPSPTAEDEVPLLEDVVHGGVSINETFFAGEGDFAESSEASGLDEHIFKALLSDEWRESARELLDEARSAIEQHQTEWTPAHTDELNAALKVRIDETLQQWLREVVQSRIDELRHELLRAVGAQIQDIVAAQLDQPREERDGE